mmetsp:Transcript_99352/g.270077  ORF Transcript_99352/g.270077 Transcript_99352/m.270077 type:complete len:258 (-) Transcript_99352:673-1446(-)
MCRASRRTAGAAPGGGSLPGSLLGRLRPGAAALHARAAHDLGGGEAGHARGLRQPRRAVHGYRFRGTVWPAEGGRGVEGGGLRVRHHAGSWHHGGRGDVGHGCAARGRQGPHPGQRSLRAPPSDHLPVPRHRARVPGVARRPGGVRGGDPGEAAPGRGGLWAPILHPRLGGAPRDHGRRDKPAAGARGGREAGVRRRVPAGGLHERVRRLRPPDGLGHRLRRELVEQVHRGCPGLLLRPLRARRAGAGGGQRAQPLA